MPGADDIFWVSQLHVALEGAGYCCGDEEIEAWLFGSQTESALLTFQVPFPSISWMNGCPACGVSYRLEPPAGDLLAWLDVRTWQGMAWDYNSN